jgi:hypothetical protein
LPLRVLPEAVVEVVRLATSIDDAAISSVSGKMRHGAHRLIVGERTTP